MGISYRARSFNLGVAGGAGAAVAFAVFAMPATFEGLAAMVALPALVDASGSAGRAAATASGVAAFLFVWLLLQAVDRLEARRAPDVEEPATDWLAPRLRRADSHPDAPAPRPILARSELGEPTARELADALEAERQILDLSGYHTEPVGWKRRLVAIDGEHKQPAIAAEEGEELQEAAVERTPPASLIARLSLPHESGGTVSSLIERLDTSLAACEWPLPSQPPEAPAQDVDDRLRSALDELQKMAVRNG